MIPIPKVHQVNNGNSSIPVKKTNTGTYLCLTFHISGAAATAGDPTAARAAGPSAAETAASLPAAEPEQQLSDAEEQLNRPQFIPVAKELLDRLNQFDELKLHPLETKEDFKAIIPRHLKRHWRWV